MVLSGFSVSRCTAADFGATGLALALLGAATLGLLGGAAFATTDLALGGGASFTVFFMGAGASLTLAATALAAAGDFEAAATGGAALAADFLALLVTGLLTGFLAAVATIDSSVGDTALKN